LAAIRYIARAIGKRSNDIGYAGLKDAHGVTRQTFSVEHVDPESIGSLELARIRVLSVDRHTNKLKLGHLAGNRFTIRIRDVAPNAISLARPILDILATRGLPNYFGPQRFGARGDNALVGMAVLCGDYDEAMALMLGRPAPGERGGVQQARRLFDAGKWTEAAAAWPPAFREQARVCRAVAKAGGDPGAGWRAVEHSLRRLYLSAVQSDWFNRVVARRIPTIDRVKSGDLAWKHRNGAVFLVEDSAREQPRCDAFEISPTGPLFGRRMTDAGGRQGELEAEVLASSGVSRESLALGEGRTLQGARRPLRVPVTALSVNSAEDDRGPCLQLDFDLPPGAYATCVTREVCKGDAMTD
jgi:tRNA pseudouridine13 synthase